MSHEWRSFKHLWHLHVSVNCLTGLGFGFTCLEFMHVCIYTFFYFPSLLFMRLLWAGHLLFCVTYRCEKSRSCPFCRGGLKWVKSDDLWVYVDKSDIYDLSLILRENCKRLFMYIEKLPLIVPDHAIVPYDYHVRWALLL